MTKALMVPNWSRYEPSDAKKCRVMQWVAVPIAHDGLGYIEIMANPDGIRMIGGWLLILQTAARCPVRGLLVSDSGRVLRAREIALKTRAQESDINACITALLANGWLVEIDADEAIRMASGSNPDDVGTTGQDRTRKDKTGEDSAGARPPTGCESLVAAIKASNAAGGTAREREALDEWIALTTNDVECRDDAESAEAVRWMIRQAKKDGIAARYARQVQDRVESCRCHMERYRSERPKSRAQVA